MTTSGPIWGVPLQQKTQILAVIVLILILFLLDKVEFSHYLGHDDLRMKITKVKNINDTIYYPQRKATATTKNITNATISSSPLPAVERQSITPQTKPVAATTNNNRDTAFPPHRTAEGQSNNLLTKTGMPSPACRPHFQLALPDGNWTMDTKFKRIYFYHTRKAGGTTLRRYFKKVAAHHGLEFAVDEYIAAEDPGTHDEATFYVTNLREPVARSISHFKYEGRWNCEQLQNNKTFIPTEENAQKLSAWNQQFGFKPPVCKHKEFKMGHCAVNCYIQWFAGLSCTRWEVRATRQYEVARGKLLRYNLILITEMLRDPDYAAAVERFFGVPGVADRNAHPWCAVKSHNANERVPLVIEEETVANLTRLNKADIGLYHEMKDCLGEESGKYDFPSWDPDRFEMNES